MSLIFSKRNFQRNDYYHSSEWLFCDHLRPIENRSLIGRTRALLSMKMAVFTDSPMNFVTPSGKRGQIPDEKGKIARLSGKKA